MGEFFHQVIAVHAARGEVELTTVRLSGELAAYVLCFLDRGVYRMWNCRLAPKWVRYGVGRVGNDAALRCALEDPGCREFDWMLGEEPYKFSMSNLLKRSEDLLAWSSVGVKTVFDMRRRLRDRAKQAASQHEWLQAALMLTRQVQSAGLRTLNTRRPSRSRSGRSQSAASDLQLESTGDLERLAPEWEHLAERLQATPFLRPGWFDAWWKAFGKGQLEIWTVRDRTAGRLAAVLPLQRRLGALSSPTNWHSPEFGILADRPEALELLLTSLLERRPRRLSLAFLDDARADRVEAAASARGYRVIRRAQLESPYVTIDGGFDAYLDSLSPKLRSDLRRRQRQFEKRGAVEIDITCAERLDAQLEEGFRIEGSGWKGAGGTAILSRPETVRFYTEMARWAAQRGWLRLAFLRLDGKPVAFNLCLEQGGVHYLLKSGYDEAHADIAPGKVLRFEMIGRAFCLGLSSYEFLGSAEHSKLDWTSTTRQRWLVQGFRGSPLGALDWSACTYGRPLAKNLRNLARQARGMAPRARQLAGAGAQRTS